MVFKQHRCIQIHVPKTAGQAISALLSPGIHNVEAFPFEKAGIGRNSTHITASEMRDHDPSGLWDSHFKFAFFRNPWDRVASEFLWRQARREVRVSFDSLEEFLRAAIDGWEFEQYVPFEKLPSVNQRRKDPSESHSAMHTPTTRKLVEELWGDDIEFFNYEFATL